MKSLFQINVTANCASTGKIVESIGLAAIKRGWKSYVAYGRIANTSQSQLVKVGGRMNTYIHYAYDQLFDMEGRSSVCATKKLLKQIVEINPDVVQLHNIHDHYLNYRLLFEYLNQTNIKVVWTFHDCWAFTGHCYHFVRYSCLKWQTHFSCCPQINRLKDRSYSNFQLKKSLFSANQNLTIVPCSVWMGNFVEQSFLKNKRIQVIHNGVDINIFNVHTERKETPKKFRIIAVSNIWPAYKGFFDILKLRQLLSDEFEITIVGVSSKQLKSLPNGVVGIKRTQNVLQLVDLYNDSDVLINPTYSDTFPTVNLEALACGTPVITYRTGGSPEAIDDKTGVVVEQGDVQAMADAIIQMKASPLSSVDCRKRAEKYFDKNKCFEKYIDLYNELLAK